MLIQTSSPRPIVSLDDYPAHIVIHTLRKPGVSNGSVMLNMTTNLEMGSRSTGEVLPFEIFPIEGDSGFEALEYYLPFSQILGTEPNPKSSLTSGSNLSLVSKSSYGKSPQRDTLMALFTAGGINVIAKSAYRSEGSQYEERIFSFQTIFPITGGGIVRVTGSLFDITNPTFNPKAPMPTYSYPNSTLLGAFNRTHKPTTSDIEDRKQARIAAAEASMLAARGLPSKKD